MTREPLAGITEPVGAAFFIDLNALRAAADPARLGKVVCSVGRGRDYGTRSKEPAHGRVTLHETALNEAPRATSTPVTEAGLDHHE